jgi:nucleotide-binding universal stress UspA family protein
VSSPIKELELRRILVALDASPHSLSALSAAADLARRTEAELIGLFVEDQALLSFADVPCAREILYLSAKDSRLDRTGMERRLRTQSELARKALETAAKEAKVPWSFQTVRGDVRAELLAASMEVDLVAIGKLGWSIGPSVRIGSLALELVSRSVPLLVSCSTGTRSRTHVFVCYDGSFSAKRAVLLAGRMAKTDGGSIVAILEISAGETGTSMERDVVELLEGSGLDVQFRYAGQGAPSKIPPALDLASDAVFVVGGKQPLTRRPWLDTLLRKGGIRLLLLQDGETQRVR